MAVPGRMATDGMEWAGNAIHEARVALGRTPTTPRARPAGRVAASPLPSSAAAVLAAPAPREVPTQPAPPCVQPTVFAKFGVKSGTAKSGDGRERKTQQETIEAMLAFDQRQGEAPDRRLPREQHLPPSATSIPSRACLSQMVSAESMSSQNHCLQSDDLGVEIAVPTGSLCEVPAKLRLPPKSTELGALLDAVPRPRPGRRAGREAHADVLDVKETGRRGSRARRRHARGGASRFRALSKSSSEGSTHGATPRQRERSLDSAVRNDSVTSSICSGRNSTTCYLNFDKFDVQMDNGRAPTQLRSWDNLLCKAGGAEAVDASGDDVGPNLRQAIEWYGWEEPTKFQAVAIPCVAQACRNVVTSRSYTLLQARAGIGKTSALAVSLLSSVQREVSALQYVCLGVEACEDMEKYINTLGCLSPIRVAYFPEAENASLEDDVCKAMEAQVLVGHPSRIFEMLARAQDRLTLAGVEALMLDDASKLIEQQLVQKACEVNKLLSTVVRRPLRYIVVSDFVENEAKNALRALKSSLMSKRNMFDISAQVQRIRKHVKHYIVHSSPEEWVSSLQSLRKLIFIPRAVIFCDDESRFAKLKRQFEKAFTEGQRDRGKEMSFGVCDGSMSGGVLDPSSQSLEQREKVMSMFVNGQYDFLLTRSEPNIFQSSLPRVFWVIHFGVDGKNLRDLYGARLMCLDSSLRRKGGPHQDGVSLLFLAQKDEGAVPVLQKSLKIKFEPVPLVDI